VTNGTTGLRDARATTRCCSAYYGHRATRWLLDDSFHPGGLELTAELAILAGGGPESRVLEAGSGSGASAVHLARSSGCAVLAVTSEKEGAAYGKRQAEPASV